MQPYRCGVEIIRALAETDRSFTWRAEPYEFVQDRPAIDLLAGTSALRRAVEDESDVGAWLGSWAADERRFRADTEAILLYNGAGDGSRDR
jgi:hypothetical protein